MNDNNIKPAFKCFRQPGHRPPLVDTLTKIRNLGMSINILLVEDEPMATRAIKGSFKDLGCQVEVANCGLVALEKLHNPFQLIICDLGLPDLNGMEVARQFRHSPGPNSQTPILIATAHGDKKLKAEARELGLTGFLHKPVLYELCEQILNRLVLSQPPAGYFFEN